MKQKYYVIDVKMVQTLTRKCPVCKKEVRKENAEEVDYELISCPHCGKSFQYDREFEDSNDEYRYELLSEE